jgi:hypothetical protein
MEFSPQETKLIARLRKEDRQWSRLRWVMLAAGVIGLTACVLWSYLLYQMTVRLQRVSLDGAETVILILFCAKCCLNLVVAVWCLGTAATKWHGDGRRMLLKLLDANSAPESH